MTRVLGVVNIQCVTTKFLMLVWTLEILENLCTFIHAGFSPWLAPLPLSSRTLPSTGDAKMGKAQSLPSESSQCNGGGMWVHQHRLLPSYLVHAALSYSLSCSDTPGTPITL